MAKSKKEKKKKLTLNKNEEKNARTQLEVARMDGEGGAAGASYFDKDTGSLG